MKIWWCNQRRGWTAEYNAGVVCSSADADQLKYRKLVGEARKGDVVLHYRRPHGIAAVSKVSKDAIECPRGSKQRICLYGEGWSFRTDYHLLTPPIPMDAVIAELLALQMPDGPVQGLHDGRARVRQAYFMRITPDALQVVVRAGRDRDWPVWVHNVLRIQKRRRSESEAVDITAVEGFAKEIRTMARGRNSRLRDLALEKSGGVCEVCERDFSRILGGAGTRALHVHHNKQLALFSAPRVTSISELSVVCATCHALIHSSPKHAMSVSQLQRKLRKEDFLGKSGT